MARILGITALNNHGHLNHWWQIVLVVIIAASVAVGLLTILWTIINAIRAYFKVNTKTGYNSHGTNLAIETLPNPDTATSNYSMATRPQNHPFPCPEAITTETIKFRRIPWRHLHTSYSRSSACAIPMGGHNSEYLESGSGHSSGR